MNEPIIVEHTFAASAEDVWKAITQLDLMIQWFFENIPAFQPEVGFKTQFLVTNEGRNFTHLWQVTEVFPQKKISYSWRYEEYPQGDGLVSFEIFSSEKDTVLKVTALGMDTFPSEIPEFKRESCEGGWKYFIKDRLHTFLSR